MKSDADFERDLAVSVPRVVNFADQMRAVGFYAEASPTKVRPDSSVRMKHGDDGDLMLCVRVEHKVRYSVDFTSRDSFPFPTVIIDEVYKVDRAKDPVFAYVIENASGTCAAVIYGFTRPNWKIERRWDPRQKRECNFYTLDKKYVRFCSPAEAFFVGADKPVNAIDDFEILCV